jgi:uncharacterized RDD family membrane protein YckC
MIRYGDSWVCPECKPVFVQKIKEGVKLAGTMEYAGFWIRFAAKFIDWLILLVPSGVLRGLFMGFTVFSSDPMLAPALWGLTSILQIALAASFDTWFVGKFGATPGKMAVKLKVVTAEDERVSYMRAFGRHFAEWLSYIVLCIGYIIAAFDDEKRALHDHICNTRVIRA